MNDPLSIRDLKPLNVGGVVARRGFYFQDHVAVSFCLKMLISDGLKEVWCETQDDITLIWQDGDDEWVEFIQVKDLGLSHFWSIAELCKQERNLNGQGNSGSSIIERSLAQDRCKERSQFRIVTSIKVNDDLKILMLPLDSPERTGPSKSDKVDRLITEIDQRLPGIKSENNRCAPDWVNNTIWQVGHSLDAVREQNLNQLMDVIERLGYKPDFSVIKRRVYPAILQRVVDASVAEWAIQPKKKIIFKHEFHEWLEALLREDLGSVAGEKIFTKMAKVGIPSDYIISALEERRIYRLESLRPQYLELYDRNLIDGEVLGFLQHLRLDLDVGKYEPGLPFYKVCLDKLKELRSTLRTNTTPPLFYLNGCMHDITDRCGHRYHRELL